MNSNWSYGLETPNLGQNLQIFLAVWPCNFTYDFEKTIEHLFYATSNFVHHFVAIGEFKLELQSGNAQFGSNSTIFRAMRPWKTIGHLFYATSGFVHHFVAIGEFKLRQIRGIWKLRPAHSPETPNLGQNRWCFVPCDFEIWWMTLENNGAFLLCCFKLWATFHSQRWIQTGVTVRKRPIWVKINDFLAVWPCNLTYDLEKQ